MDQKILAAIDDPNVFSFESLWQECQATQDTVSPAIYQLLSTFYKGSTKDCSSDWSQERVDKLQLLSLVDAAVRCTGSSISYEDLWKQLRLDDSLVPKEKDFILEQYLIQAMMNQILVGKINSQSRMLHVSWAMERSLNHHRIEEMKQTLSKFILRCSEVFPKTDMHPPLTKSFKRASRLSSGDGMDHYTSDKRARADDSSMEE
ncbi:COP9/signalosome complex subunit 7a [Schizosaccharomyces cryophilus OY26]|uniref:COP9/signalosome complex subunit 7a n=1 Tax=Schizosaccharomyces cryophilus (strain OY26 / ATCC MYA-4695 / CBS 11777 / NBRC 106824 / NRRL Y48691) TaxID=653667 RepID=S9W3S2_SCHCR|nr:COP9/signalosome complex subunit 7a [Schizosaccharomyces cryophilus OY26]EPY52590.1 COP9/signalosome complex subunit 7a [Schizosaccharomyces cryophilus OY26]